MASLCGALCGVLLLSLMSCGHYVVDQIEVSWEDDIERDKREIMGPMTISNEKPKRKSYDAWASNYDY